MARVELTPRATSSRFWLLVLAAILAVYAVTEILNAGERHPSTPTPEPVVTMTGTVAPSPLCTGPSDRQCWETVEESGPPWLWREKAKVRK